MSAYEVSTDTIDLLVAAAARWQVTFPVVTDGLTEERHVCTHRDEAGQLLLDENVRSVNYRYREVDDPDVYRFTPLDLKQAAAGVPLSVVVIASIRCLRYQSCETPDYATTRAAVLLDRIEAAAGHALIEAYDVPWGFTRGWMDQRAAFGDAATPRCW